MQLVGLQGPMIGLAFALQALVLQSYIFWGYMV